MRILPQLAVALFCHLLVGGTSMAATFVQDRADRATYNYANTNGVPISSLVGTPPGSDGRGATGTASASAGGTEDTATVKQFQGIISHGGLAAPRTPTNLNPALSASANAAAIGLPVARINNQVRLVLKSATLGAPFIGRSVSFQIGAVIPRPSEDENKVALTGKLPQNYWLAEPFSTNNHEGAAYYWSKHAGSVFAIQAGPVDIVWRKAIPEVYPSGSFPPGFTNNVTHFQSGANFYQLHAVHYVASGSAVKTPRQMYWTEGVFRATGKPIDVPAARISTVNIIYNNNFPKTVPHAYVAEGQSFIADQTNTLQEVRTLWYDDVQKKILAYNRTGRVFVELLGDTRPDGQSKVHLGFEIVDVNRQANPVDVTTELGDQLHAFQDAGDDSALYPEPILRVEPQAFTYAQSTAGTDRRKFYAIRETVNQSDVLIHWLQEGVQNLRWPLRLVRYRQVWPASEARYSHYVRPLAASQPEAARTAVPLPTENVPVIEYEDVTDQQRSWLSATSGFYTWLSPTYPAHRTLLRYTAGENVAFERVFSWLDTTLKAGDFADTVATNLTSVADFLAGPTNSAAYQAQVANYLTASNNHATYLTDLAAYQTASNNYAAYLTAADEYANYLAARSRGVNGDWKLYVTDKSDTDGGSLAGWTLQIETDSASSPILSFTNATTLTIPAKGNASLYPSLLSVSGVTDAVTNISVSLNGFTHGYPADIDVFLVGPGGDVTILMSDAGGSTPITNLNFGFRDTNAGILPDAAPLIATNYIPRDYTPSATPPTGESLPVHVRLGALLRPAPLVVSEPVIVSAPVKPAVVTEPTFPAIPTGQTFWPDTFASPRVVNQTVTVGERIVAPSNEEGATGSYQAGYVNQASGTSFNPSAYLNPFTEGFELANQGAIIPVNAIPGANTLEVWWFRKNQADAATGFLPSYWPEVIGRYTLGWPGKSREIVLAGNGGSGELSSQQSNGSIYAQNNPMLAGYNPNEEHAVLLGGLTQIPGNVAFALRDDLNLTATTQPAILVGSAATYSSAPFVLLDHVGADGRPAMTAFKVRREKPEEGIVFDYVAEAGQPLPPPLPLPLMAPPVAYITNYATNLAVITTNIAATNYNHEPSVHAGDLPANWDPANDPNGPDQHYRGFTYQDRKHSIWVYRGFHAGRPALHAGSYDPISMAFNASASATGIVNQPFTYHVHVSRRIETLVMTNLTALPAGLSIDGLKISGVPTETGSSTVSIRITDLGDGGMVTNSLALDVLSNGTPTSQGPLTIPSTNAFTGVVTTFTNRPPHLGVSAQNNNSFTMRFYYPTLEGFAWPGIENPPAPASIVPYLRAKNSTADPTDHDTPALDITYRPVWPATAPTLNPGQTLTRPTAGLPAVRGQSSAQVLYQQSAGTNFSTKTPSVRLHDPTSERSYQLNTNGLAKLPAGVAVESFAGKTFFPNLPPHLADRFFFNPNGGTLGELVFKGEFKDELLGEKYLQLNVVNAADLAKVKALCPDLDGDKSDWDAAIDGLATQVETFHENPAVPGTYVPNPALARSVTVTNLIEVTDDDTAVDSYALSASGPGVGYVTLITGNGEAFTPAGDPVSVHVLRVGGPLYRGEIKPLPSANPLNELFTVQHTADLAARTTEFEYQWRIAPPVDGFPLKVNAENPTMAGWSSLTNGLDQPRYTLGGAGIQVLVDNYVTMRYRPKSSNHPLYDRWSEWAEPALVEGWIKRVLAGINPFNQRVTDLFNNTVNTDANILSQAGRRYEGDVALNLSAINDYGLIEIYETVLQRGRSLSIDAGINFGPANDALLLAAGYLNDLYMIHGNEAAADASNPTIGIGTADNTYGDIATALFAFKGQVPTLLEEELALLRGRDEFLQPGTGIAPIYNRLVWNYTRGIDSGEVIYALNYNVLDQDGNGSVGAEDAARLFPQGHGDAYGHYLTALKGYYSLLLDPDFDWVPRIEAVNILGKPVSVDYQDERKFAAAAAAVARTGRQIFDLTWRNDYKSGSGIGWEHFEPVRSSSTRTRYWGMDHWASRTGQGAYLNWMVGNAILPDVDPDPTHEGIQKVDRTTVPELQELPTVMTALQASMDNAEAGLTPLGVPANSIPFDLNPNTIVGTSPQTHFEQIFERATTTLRNAVAAFDDAKDVTRLMRSEQDSLSNFQTSVAEQEFAYTNALIELYGTPYSDDIGTGKTWSQGYAGPDLIHYHYVETPESTFRGNFDFGERTFAIDVQQLPPDWITNYYMDFSFHAFNDGTPNYAKANTIEFSIDGFGNFSKPSSWTGRRSAPGEIQQGISTYITALNLLRTALNNAVFAKGDLDKATDVFKKTAKIRGTLAGFEIQAAEAELAIEKLGAGLEAADRRLETVIETADIATETVSESIPASFIAGLANGGDVFSPARAAVFATAGFAKGVSLLAGIIKYEGVRNAIREKQTTLRNLATNAIAQQFDLETREAVYELGLQLEDYQDNLTTINERMRSLDDAERAYRALIARGDRIQAERQITRQRSAAIIQGFRTRDAAFRIFRNEKLERYKELFDLAARYALMAAQAYDYETGQLGTTAGRDFVSRIIRSRALGVITDGEPQYAGSNTGDPGLSSALAEMNADWQVLKSRLGFNNPDAYGTTVSLRTEKLRILPGTAGDTNWKDVLQRGRVANLLDDADVKRDCLQIDPGDGLPVPGIILDFSTTIANGRNLFGLPSAAGDHGFSPASFATKIYSVGIALEGYEGMDDPVANANVGGGTADPGVSFLSTNGLFATPYIYLIPVGVDSMRSPPLGDASTVRTWTVNDVTIPLPFNIGASDFSTKQLWQSADSLTEQLFSTRKHQPFRPVSTVAAFSSEIYSGSGLARSQFSNRRLIGRSVWNSRWKIVIPGYTLLNDPDEGLSRFIESVRDIKLHLVTYSYSGN